MCLAPIDSGVDAATLPAARKHLEIQMSPATQRDQRSAAGESASDYLGKRLIFFGAADNKTEPALLQLFSQHGEVAVFIVRSALGISSGCGYVTFATAEQAKAALAGLNGSTDCAEAGMTLGLLLVDEGPSSSGSGAADTGPPSAASSISSPKAGSTCSGPHSQQEKLGKSVFFTKVPPTVTQNQLIQLFTACGEVAHLELFIPWPGAKISRGCGLVEFSCSRAASAAVHSMHQQFTWPHSHSALVVEWVDRSRQSGNKANKSRTAAAHGGIGAAGSPASTSLRADHQQAAAAAPGFVWRAAHSGGAAHAGFPGGAAGMQQAQLLQQQAAAAGRSSCSCPLPQLPPGWQVVGTAQQLPQAARVAGMNTQWASVPSSLSSLSGTRPLQQPGMGTANYNYPSQQAQLQHSDASGALGLQQQLQHAQRMGVYGSDAGSAGTWLACPTTSAVSNSSIPSLGSMYDATAFTASTCSSAANSGVLSQQLSAGWDQQQQAAKVLELRSQDPNACTAGQSISPGVQFSEPMLTVSAATAAAMSGVNSSDAIWQQLLQQNVMLFQTMTPPPEEETVPSHLLLPSSAAQQQGLVAHAAQGAANGLAGGLPAYLPVSQAQQLNGGAVVYTGSTLQPAQQPRQPLWFVQPGQQAQQQQPQAQQQQQPQAQQQQQQQQQQGESAAVVALPLSNRQLAAMAGVLPKVPGMTGAQVWISSAATGQLQLCLSGTYAQLQAGHTAVAMLLGESGVDEPLAPAVVHAAAS